MGNDVTPYLYKAEILSYTSGENAYPVYMTFRFQDENKVYTETV